MVSRSLVGLLTILVLAALAAPSRCIAETSGGRPGLLGVAMDGAQSGAAAVPAAPAAPADLGPRPAAPAPQPAAARKPALGSETRAQNGPGAKTTAIQFSPRKPFPYPHSKHTPLEILGNGAAGLGVAALLAGGAFWFPPLMLVGAGLFVGGVVTSILGKKK
jgi:hypothetical protein